MAADDREVALAARNDGTRQRDSDLEDIVMMTTLSKACDQKRGCRG